MAAQIIERTIRAESAPSRLEPRADWSPRGRWLGILAGWSRVGLGVVYVVTMLSGFAAVHFTLLTVGRQVNSAAIPGFAQLFAWHWPSVIYALDILAWDFCFGLGLLAAAPVFGGDRIGRSVRTSLVLAGTLCLAGLAGVVVGNMQVRNIGIVG